MSGIAVEVDFDRPTPSPDSVSSLLAAMPHRASEGCSVGAAGRCAMGFARHASTRRDSLARQPFLHRPSGLLVVADARFDNRQELAHELGAAISIPDPELLALGYARWQDDLATHVMGDFAFSIWDTKQHCLYTAVDPFGTRPLFYHWRAQRFRIASDVEALISQTDISIEINDCLILDYLMGEFRHHEQTFFRDIHRLLPGHYCVADARGLRQIRFWNPPREILHLTANECREEFRRLFRRAVQVRLDSHHPVVAQLSGGIDSSSIVCMAKEIYEGSEQRSPLLTLASALYPGLDCDESCYIDSVTQSVPFRSVRWDATSTSWPPEEEQPLATPWRTDYLAGMERACTLARQLDARVALSGHGGDQLLFERGVFRDLALHFRWLRLLRETVFVDKFYAANGTAFFFTDALRALPGTRLRRLYRRLRPRPPEPPPKWLGARLRTAWDESVPPSSHELPGMDWSSHVQRTTWNWLTEPALVWSVELQQLEASRGGVEIRFPFLDRPLATFILSLPFEHRIPGGRMKRILRDAMTGTLPEVIAQRTAVTTFDASVCAAVAQHLPRLEEVLREEPWLCQPYVERTEAKTMLHSLHQGSADWRLWMRAWDLAMLQRWLQAVDRLRNSPRRVKVGNPWQTRLTPENAILETH